MRETVQTFLLYLNSPISHLYYTSFKGLPTPQDWCKTRGSSTLCQLILCPLTTHIWLLATRSTVNHEFPFFYQVGVHEIWQLQHAHLPPSPDNYSLKLFRGDENIIASERVDQHEIKEKVKSWLMPPLNTVILTFSQFTLFKVPIFIPVSSIFSMLKLPLEFIFNLSFVFFEIWLQLQSIKNKQTHPLSPELCILWHKCKLYIQKSVCPCFQKWLII